MYKKLKNVDVEELKNMLYFLGDKVDKVYKRETDDVIKEYIDKLDKVELD